MSESAGKLIFRRAVAADRDALLDLMADLRVPVAGSNNRAAQVALVGALGDRRLVVLIAEEADRLVGICLGVIDPKRFWRDLVLRNPALLVERVAALIKRRVRRRKVDRIESSESEGLAQLLSPSSDRQWGESSPQIAHVSLVLLRPELRGSGVSAPFMAALLDELVSQGVTRMDARIARSNIASVRMCRRLGVTVEDRGANLFATADLPLMRDPS